MKDEKTLKKTKRRLSAVLWVVAIIALVLAFNSPERRVARFVADNSATLEQSLGEELNGYPGGLGIKYYNRWDGAHTMGEYILFTRGDTYYGCYYSPDDVPLAFQNIDVPLSRSSDGEGWQWQTDGDDHGYTRRLSERWYYFEASF